MKPNRLPARKTVPAASPSWPVQVLVIVATTLALAGCKAPDPKPFQTYAAAVTQAGDGLEQTMAQEVDWSRDKYITSVLNGSVKLGTTGILQKPKPFTVAFPTVNGAANPPIFYQLQDARRTLSAINGATEKYVNLLVTLAGPDLVDPKTFEGIATDVNSSLNSAVKQLNAKVPADAIPVFSVASAEILQMIVENRRHKALEKVLVSNQSNIDDYCASCRQLLKIVDQSLTTDYDTKAHALEDHFAHIPQDQRPSDPAARNDVEQLLQLNTSYMSLMDTLAAADKVYAALPRGHQNLLDALRKKPTDMQAIKDLAQEGQRLKRIYDNLKNKPN